MHQNLYAENNETYNSSAKVHFSYLQFMLKIVTTKFVHTFRKIPYLQRVDFVQMLFIFCSGAKILENTRIALTTPQITVWEQLVNIAGQWLYNVYACVCNVIYQTRYKFLNSSKFQYATENIYVTSAYDIIYLPFNCVLKNTRTIQIISN